jgi:release factor glutamine methyltransferase
MNERAMSSQYSDLLQRITQRLQFLPDKPEETPESTLRALWHAAAGTPKSAEAALIEPLPELNAAAGERLESLLARRLEGTPLAHITQRQSFVGIEMLAGPGALVPRRETELLARAAIDVSREIAQRQAALRVIDVCTGSGNVALAIAHHVPAARVFAADLSEDAVALARLNAEHLKLTGRAEFRAGDLLAPFDTPEFHGSIDVLTCNPPYISSAKVEHMHGEISQHEPHLAFDGGPFGVAILMRLLQDAPRFLTSGGRLAFEVGLGQGPAMAKRLEKIAGFKEVRPLLDHNGSIRALLARYG